MFLTTCLKETIKNEKKNVVFHFNQTHLLFFLIALKWGQHSSKSHEAQCNSRYTCKLWTCRLIYFHDQDNKITSQHLKTFSDIFGIQAIQKIKPSLARITTPRHSVYCITHASYNSINIDRFKKKLFSARRRYCSVYFLYYVRCSYYIL